MTQYGMNPLSELHTIFELWNIFRCLQPVASLHYTIKPNTFGGIAARLAGVPVLNNIAGRGRAFTDEGPMVQTLVVWLYRFALGSSHTVFFQNTDDMAFFRKKGIVHDSQCIRLPGSGVDLSR